MKELKKKIKNFKLRINQLKKIKIYNIQKYNKK
jgi:hypothetical protein